MIIPSTNDVLFASLADWVGSLKINDWDLHLSRYRNGFFLIGIHSMLGWTATTRHEVTKKEAQKRLQYTENLFRKNLQLKDVC